MRAGRCGRPWHCSRCGCVRYFLTRNGAGRQLWECFVCGYQSSSIAGTVMEHTKLPLTHWFLAMYLMTPYKNAISAFIEDFTKKAMQQWAKRYLAPGYHVVSDGTHAFRQVKAAQATHERYVTGGGRKAAQTEPLHWVNTMLGNLKTSMASTYHAFKHRKYA